MRETRSRDDGFSLLEALISIAVLAGIVLVIAEVGPGLTGQTDRSRKTEEGVSDYLITRVKIQEISDHIFSLRGELEFQGNADYFRIKRREEAGWPEPGEAPLAVFMHSEGDGNRGLNTSVGAKRQTLLSNLKFLQFAYFERTTDGGKWRDDWTRPDLPALFKIEYVAASTPDKRRKMVWKLGMP